MAAAAKAKAKQLQAAAKGKAKASSTTTTSTTNQVEKVQPVVRAKPSVTQYWGDSASSLTAPGGGIIRIGYDQARFERAVQEVIIDPKPEVKVIPEVEEGEAEAEVEVEKTTEIVEVKEEKKKIEIKKEDIALLVKEFEYTIKQAEELLKSAIVNGEIEKALEVGSRAVTC